MGKSHDLATFKDGGTIDGALTVDDRLTLDTTLGSQQLDITGVEADIWLNSTGPNKTWRILGSTGENTHKFRVYDQSNAADRLNIDASGRVTMPYQPAFRAWRDSNNWTVASTFIFDQTEYNVGGHYSTSTGRFTAPVAGIYHFNFYTIQYGSINNGYIRFWVNNARPYGGDVHFSPNSGNYWDYVSWHGDYKLNAGDYVQFISAQSHTYHGRHWSQFSGHLVG